MILFEILTICTALKWSKTGSPLNKAERREAKSLIRSANVDIWFADSNKNSKCSLRDEVQEGSLLEFHFHLIRGSALKEKSEIRIKS